MTQRKTILLADAGEEFRAMLRDEIEKTGEFSVVPARDGNEVLELIQAHHIDVLIMDAVLPGVDGLTVLRRLTEWESAPETIMISAFISDPVLSEAAELGVAYFLPKPFEVGALLDKVRGLPPHARRSGQRSPTVLVTAMLREIGMPASLKGYPYVRDAVLLAMQDASLLHAVTKVLYPSIAKRHRTTASCVERSIRHAIEEAWNRGDPEKLHAYFGSQIGSTKRKPTNGEFIAAITDLLTVENQS